MNIAITAAECNALIRHYQERSSELNAKGELTHADAREVLRMRARIAYLAQHAAYLNSRPGKGAETVPREYKGRRVVTNVQECKLCHKQALNCTCYNLGQ